jgi:hypothetical protein
MAGTRMKQSAVLRDEEVAEYLRLCESKECLIRNSTLTTNWTTLLDDDGRVVLWYMMEVMCCGT